MEPHYESLIHALGGIVWEADLETFRFTFVSQYAERLLGYPRARWLNDPTFWQDHLHPDDRAAALAYCLEHCRGTEPYEFEYRMVAADGRLVWIRDLVAFTADRHGRRMLCGFMLDVTEQKHRADTLAELQERLIASMEERERLGHNLHDNVLQSVFAVGMRIESLLTQEGLPGRARGELAAVVAHLNQVLADVRAYIQGDTPPGPTGPCLVDCLARAAARLNMTGTMRFCVNGEPRAGEGLSREQAEQVYYIAAEAMSNARRHSQARRVQVSLVRQEASTVLRIVDDGVGFDVSGPASVNHGLSHMKARAARIAAALRITSSRLAGTEIELAVPTDCSTPRALDASAGATAPGP